MSRLRRGQQRHGSRRRRDGYPTGCGDDYPNNAHSWAIFGPFSLADAIAAEVRAKVWVYTEPYNDILCLTASTDRNIFNGPCVSGYSNGWVDERFDLNRVYKSGSLLGQDGLYIGLAFVTNASDTRPHQGAFVDNLVLQKGVLPTTEASVRSGEALATLPGVTIQDETGHWALTDSDGAFELTGLTAGQHTLTPRKAGFQFYPPSITINLNNANLSGVHFVGTASTRYTVYLPLLQRAP